MSQSVKIIVSIIGVVSLGIGIAIVVYGPYRLRVVQSASMQPTMDKGDLLLIHRTDSFVAGDIASFWSSAAGGVFIAHRITRYDTVTKVVQTKGDNVDQPDWPFRPAAVEGKVVLVVPRLGQLISRAQSPVILGAFIILPTLLIVLWELLRIGRAPRLKMSSYRLR